MGEVVLSQLAEVDEDAAGEDEAASLEVAVSPVIPSKPTIVKRASILDRERDFIKLFVHHAGVSEVPRSFLEWGAVSLIASCMAERTYHCFLSPTTPLYPNLYVFLLADSGVGKGVTCDLVTSYLQSTEKKRLTGFEESRTTAQGTMDRLAGKSKKLSFVEALIAMKSKQEEDEYANETPQERAERLADQHRVYLVFEELAASVGTGIRANDFTVFLTKSYGGKGYVDRTRTHGEIDFSGLISVNVLAGSTHRWLKDCVSLDAVLGGFFARVFIVDGDLEGHKIRIWRPEYSPDVDLVRQHLERRVNELIQLSGEFKLTDEADALGKYWYMNRPEPDDPSLEPIFRRERATMLKLAHVFACSEMDGKTDFKIHSRHVMRAQNAIRGMTSGLHRVVAHSSVTRETRGYLEIRAFITKNPWVTYGTVAKYANSIGVGAEGLRSIFNMLRDIGDLEVILSNNIKKYRITTFKFSLSDVPDEDHSHDMGGAENSNRGNADSADMEASDGPIITDINDDEDESDSS